MEPHSPKSPRFTDTPPGSPKSCMKGARKQLTFDKPGDVVMTTGSGGNPSPIPSPKRSPRSVSIRMHDDDGSSDGGSPRVTSFDLPSSSSSSEKKQKAPPPEEIKFQFQLTQHYDQSTPPPNCTSNGNYDFDRTQETSTSTTCDDPRKDPQLVEIATRFVNDIIENAKVEAANRAKADSRAPPQGTSNDRDSFTNGMGRGIGMPGAGNWYRRAHGLVSKWITNICVRAQNIRADLK